MSALWITNSRGDILLAQRSFNKAHDPGKWGPAVAGTIEENETYEENIMKEAEEELGIKDIKFKLGPKVFRKGKHLHFTQWFTCIIDKPESYFKIQADEVAAVKWLSKEKLIADAKENPQNYLSSAPEWIHQFTS